MTKAVVPIRRPQRQSRREPMLWFVQVITVVFHASSRVQEMLASGEERERLRAYRIKVNALRHDTKVMLQQIEQSGGKSTREILDDFVARHADADTLATFRDRDDTVVRIEQESKELQGIVRGAGEDKARAVEGLRAYLVAHPESQWGHSYLGGALKQVGDWEGSLTAYREAVRLAGSDATPDTMDRLQIGVVLQEKGELTEATAQFCRVIEESSPEVGGSFALAYLYLGDALEQSGDVVNARVAWKQAMSWDEAKVLTDKVREKLRTARKG